MRFDTKKIGEKNEGAIYLNRQTGASAGKEKKNGLN